MLSRQGDTVLIGVSNSSEAATGLQRQSLNRVDGRGLLLVEACSKDWGWRLGSRSPMPNDHPDQDQLLRPREVAEIFGVRTTTIARWARKGGLTPFRTPGGYRRYTRDAVAVVRLVAQDTTPDEAERRWAEDAAHLYDQG